MFQSTEPEATFLIIGYGAAGCPFANGMVRAGAKVAALDPQPSERARKEAADLDIPLLASLPADLSAFDVIVLIVPSDVVRSVTEKIAASPGAPLVLDLSSSPPELMSAVAALLPGRFVDGAILGAVGITGHRTPCILAGDEAQQVAALLRPFGCEMTVLVGASPGAASSLKLLRSVLTKGMEALVVELYTSAKTLGLSDQVPVILADLENVRLRRLLEEMLRTHPRHAERRFKEIAAARDILERNGLPTPMTGATCAVFQRTATKGPGPDETSAEALRWLCRNVLRTAAA